MSDAPPAGHGERDAPRTPETAAAPPGPAPRVDSHRLFRGATELLIDHHGEIYRLKQTALGKLILTK